MTLPEKISEWPPEWRELWNERSGVMEFDGGMSRRHAEAQAESDVRKIAEGRTDAT